MAVTPNGYADAVSGNHFVMPEERTMSLAEFLDIIEQPNSANGIFYIQKQNSNFTDEFKDIIGDAGLDIPWATEAFGRCFHTSKYITTINFMKVPNDIRYQDFLIKS